jgi:hypothetical protein
MDTNLLMQKAAEYTEKFVNAAVPVAKKAYEIGLLTIQIDAVQQLVLSLICALAILGIVLGFKKIWKWDIHGKHDYNYPEGLPSTISGLIGSITIGGLAIQAINLFNVWLWVKLFHPDLWLAKQAIEKVLEVSTK